jgi:hypothetical protein
MTQDDTPRLARYLNWSTLWGLPDWSSGPKGDVDAVLQRVRQAGYVGLQHVDAALVKSHGLRAAGSGNILKPSDAAPLAQLHALQGFECTTLHVGTGLETDSEMDALAQAVLAATQASGHPLYIETHRATITQDMRRTVDLVTRFPNLRFNADLSHWYTGLEMPYGDFNAKLDFIDPVLKRVRFLHGRIGNSGSMQVRIDGAGGTHIDHFKTMWRRCFEGFIATARSGEDLIFAPELLPAFIDFGGARHEFNYARLFDDGAGGLKEESDRWQQAAFISDMAADLFDEALKKMGASK